MITSEKIHNTTTTSRSLTPSATHWCYHRLRCLTFAVTTRVWSYWLSHRSQNHVLPLSKVWHLSFRTTPIHLTPPAPRTTRHQPPRAMPGVLRKFGVSAVPLAQASRWLVETWRLVYRRGRRGNSVPPKELFSVTSQPILVPTADCPSVKRHSTGTQFGFVQQGCLIVMYAKVIFLYSRPSFKRFPH